MVVFCLESILSSIRNYCESRYKETDSHTIRSVILHSIPVCNDCILRSLTIILNCESVCFILANGMPFL